MKLKKIISLGLATVLSLSMFAGCGEKNPNTDQPGDGDQVSPTVTQSPDDGDNEGNGSDVRFVENIYDMGGKTIKIHDNWMYNFLLGDSSGWNRWETTAGAVIEQIEKDYNVNIEILSDFGKLGENVSTAAAAGQVYANIIVAQSVYSSKIEPYAADVTKIKNLGIGTNDWQELGKWALDKEGRQVAVNFATQEYGAMIPDVICFNKELVEQYEIEDIYELVRNNEWTYDKFEEICHEITQKSNGAVKGVLDPNNKLPLLSLMNNAEYVIEKDGKYVYNGLSEEVVSGLEFCQNLVNQGLYDIDTYFAPDMATVGDRTNAFGREHKTLFFVTSYTWLVSDIDYRLEDYGIVPLPTGPYNNGSTGVVGNGMIYMFTEGDPDIEDAAAVLVAMANRLSVTNEEYFKNHFDRGYIRDEESLENLLAMFENPASNYYELDALVTPFILDSAQKSVYKLNGTARQMLEEIAPQVQAAIDERMNH